MINQAKDQGMSLTDASVRDQLIRRLKQVTQRLYDRELYHDHHEEQDLILFHRQQEQQQLLLDNSRVITNRAKQVAEIEQAMQDINQITRDLSACIVDQGTTLDTIEHNMSSADENVQIGTDQISKAAQYQVRTMRK